MPGHSKRPRFEHVYDSFGLLVKRIPISTLPDVEKPGEAMPESSAEGEALPLTTHTDLTLDAAQAEPSTNGSYVFGSAAAPPKEPEEGAPGVAAPLELCPIQVTAPLPGCMPTAVGSATVMQEKPGGPKVSSLKIIPMLSRAEAMRATVPEPAAGTTDPERCYN